MAAPLNVERSNIERSNGERRILERRMTERRTIERRLRLSVDYGWRSNMLGPWFRPLGAQQDPDLGP
jgi:hypothetical protein